MSSLAQFASENNLPLHTVTAAKTASDTLVRQKNEEWWSQTTLWTPNMKISIIVLLATLGALITVPLGLITILFFFLIPMNLFHLYDLHEFYSYKKGAPWWTETLKLSAADTFQMSLRFMPKFERDLLKDCLAKNTQTAVGFIRVIDAPDQEFSGGLLMAVYVFTDSEELVIWINDLK
jgi:hypothetical protein